MIAPDLSQSIELLILTLQQGAQPYLMVTSDSMAPLIRQGDEIQVAQMNHTEPVIGDILVVQDADGFLAHRYWASFSNDGQDYLLLRGDRIKDFDSPFAASQLVGIVVARRRGNRTLELKHGIGRTLNDQLMKLALFAIPPPTPLNEQDLAQLAGSHQSDEQLNRIDRRVVYRLLYHTAQVLTLTTDLLNQIQGTLRRQKAP